MDPHLDFQTSEESTLMDSGGDEPALKKLKLANGCAYAGKRPPARDESPRKRRSSRVGRTPAKSREAVDDSDSSEFDIDQVMDVMYAGAPPPTFSKRRRMHESSLPKVTAEPEVDDIDCVSPANASTGLVGQDERAIESITQKPAAQWSYCGKRLLRRNGRLEPARRQSRDPLRGAFNVFAGKHPNELRGEAASRGAAASTNGSTEPDALEVSEPEDDEWEAAPPLSGAVSSISDDEFIDDDGIVTTTSSGSAEDTMSEIDTLLEYYRPAQEDRQETAALRVPGETVLDADCEDSASDSGCSTASSSDSRDVPVRELRDYIIYDRESRRIVTLGKLFHTDERDLVNFGISGQIRKHTEEDAEDSAMDGESSEDAVEGFCEEPDCSDQFALSEILQVDVHDIEDGIINRHMYVRTSHAWYILDRPSAKYRRFYEPFWRKVEFFNDLFEDLMDEGNDDDDYYAYRDEYASTRGYIFEEDMDTYVIATFSDLCEGDRDLAKLKKNSFLRTLFQSTQTRTRGGKQNAGVAVEKTVVTPAVYSIAKDIFLTGLLRVVDVPNPADRPVPREPVPTHRIHAGDIRKVQWIESQTNTNTQAVPKYHRAVLLDGVRYDVGDVVVVGAGLDANEARDTNAQDEHSRCSNRLVNSKWFGEICYFYVDPKDGKIMFHARWYLHGVFTMLQETAHPQGLYLVDECDDEPVDTIYQKANVRILEPGEDEPTMSPATQNDFFTRRLVWNEEHVSFTERTEAEDDCMKLAWCPAGKPCVACAVEEHDRSQDLWTEGDETISHSGVDYHLRDFVYVRPNVPNCSHRLYIVGQILGIQPSDDEDDNEYLSVRIQLYERRDTLIRAEHRGTFGPYTSDERQLFRSSKVLRDVAVDRIEGKVYVAHARSMTSEKLEEWLTHDNHFYVKAYMPSGSTGTDVKNLKRLHPADVTRCTECWDAREQQLEDARQNLATSDKLRGFELFAGAGGLSLGLEQAGVDIRWAIEMDTDAAMTYRSNHPQTHMFNESVNTFLESAFSLSQEAVDGTSSKASNASGRRLQQMPKRGEVDLICGGPPCQAFSRARHASMAERRGDPRCTLAAAMLSFVDFYRPAYFLLENVVGFLHFESEQELTADGEQITRTVEMGAVKFIMRTMISFGYQIHLHVLNAAHYGAPQRRHRVVFLASRPGHPLPSFPLPTHTTPKDDFKRTLTIGTQLYPIVRYRPWGIDLQDKDCDPKVHYQWAPHHGITAENAISDLPPFDWQNSECVSDTTPAQCVELSLRQADGIVSLEAITRRKSTGKGKKEEATAEDRLCGFVDAREYPHEPQNRYQSEMRSFDERDSPHQLRDHCSSRYGALCVERVFNLPMKPNATLNDLPKKLGGRGGAPPPSGPTIRHKKQYVRINGALPFSTLMTDPYPGTSGNVVVHPAQKRILTLREYARVQGFPDWFTFKSDSADPRKAIENKYKQVGNAVPVHLGRALGVEILKATAKGRHDKDKAEADAIARELSPEI